MTTAGFLYGPFQVAGGLDHSFSWLAAHGPLIRVPLALYYNLTGGTHEILFDNSLGLGLKAFKARPLGSSPCSFCC